MEKYVSFYWTEKNRSLATRLTKSGLGKDFLIFSKNSQKLSKTCSKNYQKKNFQKFLGINRKNVLKIIEKIKKKIEKKFQKFHLCRTLPERRSLTTKPQIWLVVTISYLFIQFLSFLTDFLDVLHYRSLITKTNNLVQYRVMFFGFYRLEHLLLNG